MEVGVIQGLHGFCQDKIGQLAVKRGHGIFQQWFMISLPPGHFVAKNYNVDPL